MDLSNVSSEQLRRENAYNAGKHGGMLFRLRELKYDRGMTKDQILDVEARHRRESDADRARIMGE